MRKKRVLVTGGAGFIGSNVARWLEARNYSVIGMDDLSFGRKENLPEDIPLIVGDVGNPLVWRDVPAVDAIVHLAGSSSTPMFSENLAAAFTNNVAGFLTVLEEGQKRNVSRILYASTSLIYGNNPNTLYEDSPTSPLNFYALSKHAMEGIASLYQSRHGLECVGLRFMSIYGPREEHKGRMANLVSQFVWAINSGSAPIVYGDGSQTRDFTCVWDVAQAIERLVDHDGPIIDPVLNVGTGVATSLNTLLDSLAHVMNVPVRAEYVPNPMIGAYNDNQCSNIDKLSLLTGYRPSIALTRGIEEVLRSIVPNERVAVASLLHR